MLRDSDGMACTGICRDSAFDDGYQNNKLQAWFKTELRQLRDALLADVSHCLAKSQKENRQEFRDQEKLLRKLFLHHSEPEDMRSLSFNMCRNDDPEEPRSKPVTLSSSKHCDSDPCLIPGAVRFSNDCDQTSSPRESASTDLDAIVPTQEDGDTGVESAALARRQTTKSLLHARTRLLADDAWESRRSAGNQGVFASLVHRPVLGDTDARQDYYKDHGVAQAVARSNMFQYSTYAVISFNALYLGFDAALNDAAYLWSASWPFILGENLFCTYFFVEWVIRFVAFDKKTDGLKDFHFKFDSILAGLMIMETWGVTLVYFMSGRKLKLPSAPTMLRLVRILRLARLARLVRSQPELVTITRGLARALRAVLSILLFIGMANYVWAIAIYSFLRDEPRVEKYFGSFSSCMWTLLLDGTLMDSTGLVVKALISAGTVKCTLGLFAFLAYLALTAFILLNLLVGILCEVVTSVAAEEKDKVDVDQLKKTVDHEFKSHASGRRRTMSGHELCSVLESHRSRELLIDLGVDISYLKDFLDLHFSDGMDHKITVDKVIRLILECRSYQPATVKSVATATRLTLAWLERIAATKELVDGQFGEKELHLVCTESVE